MALYTETVTIVSVSIEGGGNFNGMSGMPHPIVNGIVTPPAPQPAQAFVTIRSDDNSRRTFPIDQADAPNYTPGGTLVLSISAPLKSV